jgi:predicted DCC family thiol-disulfide oxidoreductase YuxK
MLMTLDDQTRLELISLVKHAVSEAVEAHPLSPDEVHWVRMAIQAEADRAAFRKAVIDKSLAGVIWMILATGGGYLVDFFLRHWR